MFRRPDALSGIRYLDYVGNWKLPLDWSWGHWRAVRRWLCDADNLRGSPAVGDLSYHTKLRLMHHTGGDALCFPAPAPVSPGVSAAWTG